MATIPLTKNLAEMMMFIQHHRILGNRSAFATGIEYQRQGFPHDHILYWSDSDTEDVHPVEGVKSVHDGFPTLH
jgi:hypothetical protein